MDLGIAGKWALVCAGSKGLGKGCALALAREGVSLVITARGREALEATAAEIRKATGAKVTAVAGDITTAEGRAAALAACPSSGSVEAATIKFIIRDFTVKGLKKSEKMIAKLAARVVAQFPGSKAEVKVSESGRRMAQGTCPVCGTKMNRILGKA